MLWSPYLGFIGGVLCPTTQWSRRGESHAPFLCVISPRGSLWALDSGWHMTAVRIAAAGNTEVPAYLALVARGFEVSRDGQSLWVATKGEAVFLADSPLKLLGAVAMFECRGPEWQASDQQIEEFLRRFQP